MNTILNNGDYQIIIKNNCFLNIKKHIAPLLTNNQLVIITDTNVSKLYLEPLSNSLKDYQITKIILPTGETTKSLTNVANVYNTLATNNVTRSATIIALGGGVIGDIAGFVASTYLRGINFIQIPTSLLAQVDSAIGSKVGVNIASGKNLVGSFYKPKVVIIDPVLLKTLPPREFNSGMAEVIKYGVILDKELFNTLEHVAINEIDIHLEEIIYRCCELKGLVVKQDPYDNGIRKKLNFGHTYGHAIEQFYNYQKYTHGEAVAIGMLRILKQYPIDGIIINRLKALLLKFNLPIEDDVTNIELLTTIYNDKKANEEDIDIITIKAIGSSIIKTIKIKTLGV